MTSHLDCVVFQAGLALIYKLLPLHSVGATLGMHLSSGGGVTWLCLTMQVRL